MIVSSTSQFPPAGLEIDGKTNKPQIMCGFVVPFRQGRSDRQMGYG